MRGFQVTFNVLFILSILVTTGISAEIHGVVTDSRTGDPLQLANIVLEGTPIGTSTDSLGEYRLPHLQHGSYTVSASYLGYNVEKKRVYVQSEKVALNFLLEIQLIEGQEVVFSGTRAREGRTPTTFTDISGAELRENYHAQDIPPMLQRIPSVYSYSDAGNDFGYTYLKIRGFDQTRVGVTLNNIPLNDPEDGEVYWVDMPDLAANVADIQVQRGVGFSTYGSSTFGGSVNMVTTTPSTQEPFMETSFGGGSYNTRKWGVALNSGLVNNTYGFYGRFSRIQTDGYRDRSGVELWSYFLTGVRYGENTVLRVNVFGGPELTHAAWNASAESALKQNRRHNPIEYKNTIDSFNQPHCEVHHEWKVADGIRLDNTFFYIRGEGYYEQFKTDRDLTTFGFQPYTENGSTITTTDLVDQKWVKKDHVGWIPSVNWEHKRGVLQVGADLQWYQSENYGYVIWANQLPPAARPQNTYYAYDGRVNRGGAFIRERFQLQKNIFITGDMEVRYHSYGFEQNEKGNFSGAELNQFEVDYLFFNPKFGATWQPAEKFNVFASIGQSHRAPVNNEYWDIWTGPEDIGNDPLFNKSDTLYENGQVAGVEWSDPKFDPESVLDLEAGASFKSGKFFSKVNVYHMSFQNEIIPYGGYDPDRGVLVDNADESIHQGVEFEARYEGERGPFCWANLTLSQNMLESYSIFEVADWNTMEVATTDLSGNTIALFPSTMAQGGIGFRTSMLDLFLDLRYIDKQYLDNREDEDRVIDPYRVLGASLLYKIPSEITFGEWEVKFRVNNILNEQYEPSGWYDAWEGENFYFVGAERNFFVTATMRL
ncbi:TonB-dependent receptor [bacterium]|nr:TonB-dependent receptor [bacterium]